MTGESLGLPSLHTEERSAIAFFGSRRLREIRPGDVKRYAAEIAARGVAKDTVRLAFVPVRTLLATAVEHDLLDANPAAGLRLPHARPQAEGEGEEQAKALDQEELTRLVAQAAPEWRLLVALLGGTGLRPSEALALRWRDLDFGRRRVKVRRSVNKCRVGPPKTKYGRRDVPLSPGLAQALWNERKKRRAADGEPVFVDRDGERLDRAPVYRAVKAAAKRAGVPWAGLKTLRHTCASVLF